MESIADIKKCPIFVTSKPKIIYDKQYATYYFSNWYYSTRIVAR